MPNFLLLFLYVFAFIGNSIAFKFRSPSQSIMREVKSESPFRLSPTYSTEVITAPNEILEEKVIIISPKAMSHISELKAKQNGKECLRMGVRSGGCSGMSYVMDFIPDVEVTEEDHIETYGDIKCVVDPKSLLYLYGMELDYSDELIGGGFKFSNPNAESNCGCGEFICIYFQFCLFYSFFFFMMFNVFFV